MSGAATNFIIITTTKTIVVQPKDLLHLAPQLHASSPKTVSFGPSKQGKYEMSCVLYRQPMLDSQYYTLCKSTSPSWFSISFFQVRNGRYFILASEGVVCNEFDNRSTLGIRQGCRTCSLLQLNPEFFRFISKFVVSWRLREWRLLRPFRP